MLPQIPLYKNKSSTVGSVVDTGFPGIYWDEMGCLSLGEVIDSASIIFL